MTIVIPTRDRLHLLQECIEHLEETVDWRYVKLVIVDDHSRDADGGALPRVDPAEVSGPALRGGAPEDRAAPINYSHLVNLARPHLERRRCCTSTTTSTPSRPAGSEEMATWFLQADVGAVGARLVYQEKTLNHTGIIIGPHGDSPTRRYARVPAPKFLSSGMPPLARSRR